MKKNIIFTLFLTIFALQFLDAKNLSNNIHIKQLNENTSEIKVPINLSNDEVIYSRSIDVSLDNPNIELVNLKTSIEPVKSYDPIYKDVNVFNQDFEIIINAINNGKRDIKNTHLHISYITNKDNIETVTPINLFSEPENKNTKQQNVIQKIQEEPIKQAEISQDKKPEEKSTKKTFWYYLQLLSTCTQNIITQTSSNWIRAFLVFILGILMSFTPCIYPIIPITIGILQMQGSKSLLYNFLLSLSYSIGIATTFALFGLMAALTGNLFGQILTQPIFVIFIVAVLAYLALSMFGFYDMYVPKILQTNNNVNHKGSLFSAFVFGAISGSIASPCLSPGLALLLTIVATLGNNLLGFLLLFSFGIGLSIPLLIIGTFSSSINILPQAGMWMIEVKKLFGFMLFAMIFYYLKNILPYNILLWLISLFLFISGIYYLKDISSHDSRFWKTIKNILGIGLIAFSILIAVKAYQGINNETEHEISSEIWLKDYEQAVDLAKTSNKKLLIDIGANFCTICKAIDKYIFNDIKIKKLLNDFVPVKVDASDTSSEPYATLRPKYNIFGVPTILIIDPNTGELFKRWGSELYDMSIEQVIQELEKIL